MSCGVHSDKRCHNEHSSSLDKQDNGDTSALVMHYEMPLVKYSNRAGRDKWQRGAGFGGGTNKDRMLRGEFTACASDFNAVTPMLA